MIWMFYVLILGREYVLLQIGIDIKNLYIYFFIIFNYNKDIWLVIDQIVVIDVLMEFLLMGFYGFYEVM